MRDVVEMLEKNGHQVVQFRPPGVEDLLRTLFSFFNADSRFNLMAWQDEVIDQAVEVLAISAKTPAFLKRMLSPILRFLSKKTDLFLTSGLDSFYSSGLWVTNGLKDKLTYEFMSAWDKEEFDVLICPAFPFPACT